MTEKPALSVVVPVYNEADILQSCHDRIVKAIGKTGHPFEIVYVNDGSIDGSLEFLERLADRSALVSLVNLSRNYGKEIALSAGP